ncbi:MAG: DUF4956 domain-containing protein [Candidatus Bathyarchaeia archaeon]
MTEFLNPPTGFQALTIDRVLLSLIMAFIMTLFVSFIYRKAFTGAIYSRDFNMGLILVGLVVTLVTLPISSNIALSLGMIGALSIVRFRTAIKDPRDIVFTFWAITVGIICGAGLYMVAVIGCPLIGFLIFVIGRVSVHSAEPYLLVAHYSSEAEAAIQQALPKHKLRSRTVTPTGVELMVEVRMKSKDTPKIDNFLKIPGVKDVSIVSYTAEVQ